MDQWFHADIISYILIYSIVQLIRWLVPSSLSNHFNKFTPSRDGIHHRRLKDNTSQWNNSQFLFIPEFPPFPHPLTFRLHTWYFYPVFAAFPTIVSIWFKDSLVILEILFSALSSCGYILVFIHLLDSFPPASSTSLISPLFYTSILPKLCVLLENTNSHLYLFVRTRRVLILHCFIHTLNQKASFTTATKDPTICSKVSNFLGLMKLLSSNVHFPENKPLFLYLKVD